LRYLRDTDLDDPTGIVAALEQAVAAAAREFHKPVSDERNFGLKYWGHEGIDRRDRSADERAMQRFMERIDAGEIPHDEALLRPHHAVGTSSTRDGTNARFPRAAVSCRPDGTRRHSEQEPGRPAIEGVTTWSATVAR